jgi:hypothetical protein
MINGIKLSTAFIYIFQEIILTTTKTYQKRSCERVPSSLVVKFLNDDTISYGIATNISEKGMCIHTGVCLPRDSRSDIAIPLKDVQLQVPASVVWVEKTRGFYDSMGVELLNPPKKYLQIVESFKNLY